MVVSLSCVGVLLLGAAVFIGVNLFARKDQNQAMSIADAVDAAAAVDGRAGGHGAAAAAYHNPVFQQGQAGNPAGTIKFMVARTDAQPLPRSRSGRREAILTVQSDRRFIIPMEEAPSADRGATINEYAVPVALNEAHDDSGDYQQPVGDYVPPPGNRGGGARPAKDGPDDDNVYVADGFYAATGTDARGVARGGTTAVTVEYAVPVDMANTDALYVDDGYYADGNQAVGMAGTKC